jgi:hypothetical protein
MDIKNKFKIRLEINILLKIFINHSILNLHLLLLLFINQSIPQFLLEIQNQFNSTHMEENIKERIISIEVGEKKVLVSIVVKGFLLNALTHYILDSVPLFNPY